jgi:hypothetical protein
MPEAYNWCRVCFTLHIEGPQGANLVLGELGREACGAPVSVDTIIIFHAFLTCPFTVR